MKVNHRSERTGEGGRASLAQVESWGCTGTSRQSRSWREGSGWEFLAAQKYSKGLPDLKTSALQMGHVTPKVRYLKQQRDGASGKRRVG